jgi:hypothetical protein
LISIVPVWPGDEFEAARPETGLTLRVRCARENTTQGLPKTPLVELKNFLIDGASIQPELVEIKNGKGALSDVYHHLHFDEIAVGKHSATAVARHLKTGQEMRHSIEFQV